jgi:hypothetical protein
MKFPCTWDAPAEFWTSMTWFPMLQLVPVPFMVARQTPVEPWVRATVVGVAAATGVYESWR